MTRCLACTAVALLAFAASGAQARPRATAAAPTAKDALADLAALDARIDEVIQQVESDHLGADSPALMQFAGEEFPKGFAHFPEVLGLPFIRIGADVVRIDQALGRIGALDKKDVRAMKADLADAEHDASDLERGLKAARAADSSVAPPGAPDVAANIADDAKSLAAKIDRYPDLTLTEIKDAAAKIEAYKHERFVSKYLKVKVFKVDAFELFTLYTAAANEMREGAFAKDRDQALAHLRAAKAAKDKLVAALQAANPPPYFGTWTDTRTDNYVCVYLSGPKNQQGDVTLTSAGRHAIGGANPASFTLDAQGHGAVSFVTDFPDTYTFSISRKLSNGSVEEDENGTVTVPPGGDGDHGPFPPPFWPKAPACPH